MPARMIPLLLVLLCACAPLGGCGDDSSNAGPPAEDPQASQAESKAVRVTTVVTQVAPLSDVLTLPGETTPLEDVVVGAQRGGRVESITVTEGDRVKKGQLLATVDVAALAAERDRAEAALTLARQRIERRRALFGREVLAQEELDQMEAELAECEALLRKAQTDYERGFIHAPADGVINSRHVDPGEHVAEGAPVADLVNADVVRVLINVPEMDVRFLKPGDKARVVVDAFPGREWEAVADFVALKADPASRTFQVRLLLDNADGAVRPGMLARASLLRRVIPDAVTAPLFAVRDKGGERTLYVVEDGRAKARTVELGVIDKDRVQILSGLAPGDRLIVSGLDAVEDGVAVNAQ